MIIVELRTPRVGEDGYDVATTIRVVDGQADVSGDEQLVTDLVEVHGPQGRVSFSDDPEVWARYLHTAYRTPYLVPVTILDTETGEGLDLDAGDQ